MKPEEAEFPERGTFILNLVSRNPVLRKCVRRGRFIRNRVILVESLPRVASIRFGYLRFSRVALVDEDAVAESQ
jgi:hypothetical protein